MKELHTDEEGNFECRLDAGSYTIEIVNPGYLRTQWNIEVEKSTEKKAIELNRTLQVDDLILIDDLE